MKDNEIAAFPVALNLRDRAVLVLGGGDEAAQKVPRLLAAGARVTLVASEAAESLAALARARAILWCVRELSPNDLQGVALVLLTDVDVERARALRPLARRHGCLLCAIDQPAFCDLYLVSTITRGPVQIAISTSGRAPLLARRLRQALDRGIDEGFGEFARKFAALRARVRALPKSERGQVLERALAGFAMEVRLRYPEPEGHAGPPPDGAREE